MGGYERQIVGEVDGLPVVEYGYRWAVAFRRDDRWHLIPSTFSTRSSAIRDWNRTYNIDDFPEHRWRNVRRRGDAKLVKVQIVPVD